MDAQTLALSKNFTINEINQVNQTITNVTNQVTSGIKTITQQNGNQLVFTLNDDTVVTLTIVGLSSNDYTTIEKQKLALLNSDILSLFTFVNGDLLFNGNKVENNKLDLSNYYNKTEMNNLLNNKSDTSHIHNVSDVTDLENELNNRYTKTDTMSKSEIQVLVNSIIKNMTWKDSVATMEELNALSGMTIGETRIVTNITTIYTYNGTVWINLGSSANIPLASITNDGQMSKEDKAKINKIIIDGLGDKILFDDGTYKALTSLIDLTAVQGDILPSTNGLQNIGSPTNRFGKIYVNEAMLSTNTLYLGDTPVMGTNQDTITIKGDKDQSIVVKTTGIGTTNLISEGNVTLSTSGMNANVTLQATGSGSNANIGATNQVNLNAPSINIQGNTSVDNLTIRGNLSMQGQTFDVEATTVRVEDNIIELNKNEVGYGVTAGKSGIKINRGDADDYLIVFDETDDKVKIGTDSSLKSVAIEEYVDAKDLLKADKIHNHNVSDIIGTLPSAQLPIATSTTIGGVKAGTNITISADGTISSTGGSGGSAINDNATSTSTNETYSVNKINSLINEVNNTNFINANNAKTVTINAIGDNTLTTSNTFVEISNSLLAKKQNIVTALVNKGIIASQSDDLVDYATDINNIVQNSTIKNTKLNKLSGETTQVVLTNPTTIQNISTSVLEYKSGTTGIVQYNCDFNNGDSTSFNINENQHLIFDGMMKQDNKISAITMTNEGTVETYTVYSAPLDKTGFYIINSITETTVDTNEVLTISGTYNPVLVQANSDISLVGIDRISDIIWTASVTNTSKLLLIYSIDSGITWKGYDSINHVVLDISNVSDLNEVQTKGISIANLNAFTQTDLDNIRNGSPKIRFAYYLEKNDIADTLQNDKITLTVDMIGEDIFSTHYTVAFDGVKTLTYTFNANNTYTIIYTDNN